MSDYSDIAGHPWMANVLAQHGGGYKRVDKVAADEMARSHNRIVLFSSRLRAAEAKLRTLGDDDVDCIALDSFRSSLKDLERCIGILADCVDQHDAYQIGDRRDETPGGQDS